MQFLSSPTDCVGKPKTHGLIGGGVNSNLSLTNSSGNSGTKHETASVGYSNNPSRNQSGWLPQLQYRVVV